jgi:hypothetical protein
LLLLRLSRLLRQLPLVGTLLLLPLELLLMLLLTLRVLLSSTPAPTTSRGLLLPLLTLPIDSALSLSCPVAWGRA